LLRLKMEYMTKSTAYKIRQNEHENIRFRCLHLRRSSIYSYLPQHRAN
jgi:hypothetical protein